MNSEFCIKMRERVVSPRKILDYIINLTLYALIKPHYYICFCHKDMKHLTD